METLSDEELVSRAASGGESAFMALVARHERVLATLIAYEIDDPAAAEDVLQDTLVAAWVSLRRGAVPVQARAWLLRIARHRVCQHYRRPQWRTRPMADDQLTSLLDHQSVAVAADQRIRAEVIAALDDLPDEAQRVARLFYLGGLSIAQIAARHQRPAGTIKRQLHHARATLRQTLRGPGQEEPMTTHRPGAKSQPFPLVRPALSVTALAGPAPSVECPELQWWGIVPEPGEQALAGEYHGPTWRLSRVHHLHAVGPALVEGVAGTEISVSGWQPDQGWRPDAWRLFGRLTPEQTQYLAEITHDGPTSLRTFLDEGFAWAWPASRRRLVDDGLFTAERDGCFRVTRPIGDLAYGACGHHEVRVGPRAFHCLRVLGLEGPLDSSEAVVTETYVTEQGRTVLRRNYARSAEETAHGEAVTVDGQAFGLWYDALSHLACGVL